MIEEATKGCQKGGGFDLFQEYSRSVATNFMLKVQQLNAIYLYKELTGEGCVLPSRTSLFEIVYGKPYKALAWFFRPVSRCNACLATSANLAQQ